MILFGLSNPFGLGAQYIYVPEMPAQYKTKIVPLNGFNKTYVVVYVYKKVDSDYDKLYRARLEFFNRSIFSVFSSDPYYTNLSLIPYSSIKNSKYYLKKDNLNFQHQIRVNCRNYFPTLVGKKRYFLSIVENEEDLSGMSDVFDIPEHKSLLIEIDIDRREHKTSIIDTPSDIFADMCK